ncbi:MAG TPA: ribosome maturation factor RimP [Candidatus Sulfotelmatobacter sp.]|nr:ribosome maturation factor RimP [Candidatus Sulfotelmatobacter sp.]
MALAVERVREIAERVAASSGLEVVDVEFLGGGGARMLRVFLDKPGAGAEALSGVTHEDCANFSREFGTILDVEDAMPGGSYTLEVSSPGLDRKLTKAADFARFVGSRIKLMTRQPVNGNRHFEGRLEKFENNVLTLDLSVAGHKSRRKMGPDAGKTMEIEFANVEKANLVPEI